MICSLLTGGKCAPSRVKVNDMSQGTRQSKREGVSMCPRAVRARVKDHSCSDSKTVNEVASPSKRTAIASALQALTYTEVETPIAPIDCPTAQNEPAVSEPP